MGTATGVRDSRFDKVREFRFKSRFFLLIGFDWRGHFLKFFGNFQIFAKDLLRKWGANISSRAKFNVESIASGFRARRDL